MSFHQYDNKGFFLKCLVYSYFSPLYPVNMCTDIFHSVGPTDPLWMKNNFD